MMTIIGVTCKIPKEEWTTKVTDRIIEVCVLSKELGNKI